MAIQPQRPFKHWIAAIRSQWRTPRDQLKECVRSQSFSALSIRVCQPAPVALNAAMTSGDKRMVVGCLVGAF